MSKRFASVTAAALAAGLAAPAAFAADSHDIWTNGWYAQGSTGLNYLEHADNSGSNLSFRSHADNPGWNLRGAIGHDLGSGFRAEAELGYQRNDLDHLSVSNGGTLGLTSGSASGHDYTASLMGNLYYDYDLGNGFKPYVGAGLGVARVGVDGVSSNGVSIGDDTDDVFAYQAMAGIGYSLNPTSTVFLGYRYFGANDPSFTAANGTSYKSEIASHSIEVGYRLHF